MLDYNFGKIQYNGEECQFLRTKGEETSYENGTYQTFSYQDNFIKKDESCKIIRTIKKDRDTAGNYYTWYIIEDYVEKVNNFPEYDQKIEKTNAAIDYLFMMEGFDPLDSGDDNYEQNV